MNTYLIFVAKAGETWMPNWKEVGTIRARCPRDCARKYLRQWRQIAICRFTSGDHDYIFSKS